MMDMNAAFDKNFWQDKRVFLTGHTGFKGAWLSLWLNTLGANVAGFALKPPTTPNLFELADIRSFVTDFRGDIRDAETLSTALNKFRPDIIFHMAAQPIVRLSYLSPRETYETNVMGTVNLFEAVRRSNGVRAVVNITTDKCYENNEWPWGYRESDRLGGRDPYSSSKACSELVTHAYRNSFFAVEHYEEHGVAIATARAGNVIGGGDFAIDRLVPDCIRAFLNGREMVVRSPKAVRPWQHVLEPLSGYLLLARKLYEYGPQYGEAWNFGPQDSDARSVEDILGVLLNKFQSPSTYDMDKNVQFYEASSLRLDCSKARLKLNWQPKWTIEQALDKIVEWTKVYVAKGDVASISAKQIDEYVNCKGY